MNNLFFKWSDKQIGTCIKIYYAILKILLMLLAELLYNILYFKLLNAETN